MNVTAKIVRCVLIGVEIIMFLLHKSNSQIRSTPGINGSYCMSEKLQASCAEDEVILMHNAKLGRMSLGRCVKTDFGFVGCHDDVLHLADQRCSGKRRCVINVPDKMFEKPKNCNEEFKFYLEANYTCVQVATAHSHSCQISKHYKLTSKNGYLSSLVTQQTGCGDKDSPWAIQVPNGQVINLTLLDFDWKRDDVTPFALTSNKCTTLAVVREEGETERRRICVTGDRERNVFTSATNKIKVTIYRSQPGETQRHFLIKYDAVGCADPEPPHGGWFRRDGDTAYFGCNELPDRMWQLLCLRNMWKGVQNNCSEDETAIVPSEHVGFGILALPIGTAVSLIVGVAIGVSLVILIIGMFAIKGPHRRRRRQCPDEAEHQNILLKSPPVGTGFKIEYCAPVLDSSTDHVCAASLSRQSRASLNLTDVDYAYRWEEPIGVCAHSLGKITGPTYCTAPIKYTKNDYATWGTGTSGINPLLAGPEDTAHHDACAELSTGQPLNKTGQCLPSGSDTFRLDLGYGPCPTSSSKGDTMPCDIADPGDQERADVNGDCFKAQRCGSSDLCRVEEETEETAQETNELSSQGHDVQNRLNNILQNMTSST